MAAHAAMRQSATQFHTFGESDTPLRLQSGATLTPVTIAYQTYGELSPAKDNAVLVFHALTGNQNAAGFNPAVPGCSLWNDECQAGWWDPFIGPGLALDTDRLFVICCNYLGGCYGSTGPSSVNPATGKPYGPDFPYISLSDMLDCQLRLLDHFGIERLLAAVGGSMGGMLAMDMAVRHPERVRAVAPIASAITVPVLSKVSNFEQVFAIEEDAHFNKGNYYDGPRPDKGLALARMIAVKYFVSLNVLERRARDHIMQKNEGLSGYRMKHNVESYMYYQGKKFVERFDANSYLRIIDAWQSFDLVERHGDGDIAKTLSACKGQTWLIFSIDSDVCFYPDYQFEISEGLKANNIDHQHVTVHSDKGHDSFLLEPARFTPHLHFLFRELLDS